MIVAGDEFGRSQGGNNNAYCQHNEISWIDSAIDPAGRRLEEFVRLLIGIRREQIVFHRHRFFQRPGASESEIKDITWLRHDGRERGPEDWGDPEDHCLAYVLSGEAHGYHLTASGEPESDETFLAILNAHPEPRTYRAGETCRVEGRSLALLMRGNGSSLARELERW